MELSSLGKRDYSALEKVSKKNVERESVRKYTVDLTKVRRSEW